MCLHVCHGFIRQSVRDDLYRQQSTCLANSNDCDAVDEEVSELVIAVTVEELPFMWRASYLVIARNLLFQQNNIPLNTSGVNRKLTPAFLITWCSESS